jgi:hypothetical protein
MTEEDGDRVKTMEGKKLDPKNIKPNPKITTQIQASKGQEKE